MLKKLLKYELKATAIYLLPVYAIVLGISIFIRILSFIPIFQGTLLVFTQLFRVGHIFALVACGILTMVLMVFRFYNNLVTDEGYIMHTLPVSTDQLILSKLISTFVWIFCTFITIIGSVLIAYATPANLQEVYDVIINSIHTAFEISPINSILYIIILSLAMLLGVAQTMLMIYFSIACGQLFTNHRLLGSFASYAAINTITSIVSTVAMVIFALFQNITDVDQYFFDMSMGQILWGYLIMVLLFMLFWGSIYYFGTRYLLKNKLNLE